jgi:two-component system, NtrC family, nitrogen regulation sensor histidine kinase NtrY
VSSIQGTAGPAPASRDIVAEADRIGAKGPGRLGALAAIVALVSALATFLVLVGATPIAPTPSVVASVFLINGALILALGVVIAWEARGFVRAWRANAAGARLHGRIVGLFSLIATLPTVVLAIVASVALERGLSPWFSDRMRDVVLKSVDVADAYLANQCQSLGREIRILNDDLVRARPTFDVDRPWFEGFLTARATSLGLPVAQLLRSPTQTVARASIDVIKNPSLPTEDDFEEAAKAPDPICMVPREGRVFGALMRLPAYDAYLLVQREVPQVAVEFPGVSRAAAAEYLTIDAGRRAVQVAFASMFALIGLIMLFSAIWFGLNFANRFVAPIRRLINAADQVASGNFYAQVPVRKTEGDLAHLGETFNKMTSELRHQRDDLTEASEQNDRRRRFTEAVLSGVSAGVMGVDGRGTVTIANPSAEAILGTERGALSDRPLATAAPEIAALVAEAGEGRQRPVQKQITIQRGSRERTIAVRVTGEQSPAGERGYVVTLDDITDLVAAQRTSAWADVARRIAHEIKNPLTPIQLSAERIRRKYGRVITADKDIFEQCTDTIVRQVDDIKRMVDEFSSFARMPKPAIEKNDLAEIVRQAIFMMRVAHNDIRFTLAPGPDRLEAAFDGRLLSQALTNILKNATEAIAAVPESERGQPAIDVAVQVETAGEGEFVTIAVTDTGKGFPVEGRQRLLEPYMTTREGGTGLGLAIVSKILEEHGGGIELDDNPNGRGGRVRLRLRRAPESQVTKTAAAEPALAGV